MPSIGEGRATAEQGRHSATIIAFFSVKDILSNATKSTFILHYRVLLDSRHPVERGQVTDNLHTQLS